MVTGRGELLEEGKRRGKIEVGSTGLWEIKSQVPPFAFFLEVVREEMVGWEKMEMRPEQELVVK